MSNSERTGRIKVDCVFGEHSENSFTTIMASEERLLESIDRSSDGVTLAVLEVYNLQSSGSDLIFNQTLKGSSPFNLFYQVFYGAGADDTSVRKSASRALLRSDNSYTYCMLFKLNEIGSAFPGKVATLFEGTDDKKLSELEEDWKMVNIYWGTSMECVDEGNFKDAYGIFIHYIQTFSSLQADREYRLAKRVKLATRNILSEGKSVDGIVVTLGTMHTSFANTIKDPVFEVKRYIADPKPANFEPAYVLARKIINDPHAHVTALDIIQTMLADKYLASIHNDADYTQDIAKDVTRFARSFSSKREVQRFERLTRRYGFKQAAVIWNYQDL